jgi:hypothetical protein
VDDQLPGRRERHELASASSYLSANQQEHLEPPRHFYADLPHYRQWQESGGKTHDPDPASSYLIPATRNALLIISGIGGNFDEMQRA